MTLYTWFEVFWDTRKPKSEVSEVAISINDPHIFYLSRYIYKLLILELIIYFINDSHNTEIHEEMKQVHSVNIIKVV